ncbi:MAG TPA: hypothetical protein VJZ00_22115 [Thermoanaerobaculia bacterium]|nr:hypothetical protein [Thermoanaerobaculia bacterium]
MKRVLLLLACLAAACASQDASTKDSPVDIEVAQLSGPGDQGFPPGLFQVEYAVTITNHTANALTLERIDLEPMGGGGPYQLRKESYPFHETIAANESRDLPLFANAFTTGTYRSVDAYAPVSIRGIATFDSPNGKVRKIFVKVLRQ